MPGQDTDSNISENINPKADVPTSEFSESHDPSENCEVDVGRIELEVPALVSKPTVSSFAFWDGPVLLKEERRSPYIETV